MFPAVLKLYLENITVTGITFRYGPDGKPKSLCRAKAMDYITTSGGYIGQNDFGFSYISALARDFFGIHAIRRYAAEGLDIFGAEPDKILRKAKTEQEAHYAIHRPCDTDNLHRFKQRGQFRVRVVERGVFRHFLIEDGVFPENALVQNERRHRSRKQHKIKYQRAPTKFFLTDFHIYLLLIFCILFLKGDCPYF
jgi:hypothetical protein